MMQQDTITEIKPINKRIEKNSRVEIEEQIEKLYTNRDILYKMKKNIQAIKPEFYWENVTKNLAEFIKNGKISPDRQILFEEKTAPKQKRKKTFLERVWIGMKIIRRKGFRSFVRELNNYLNPSG